MIFKSYKNRYGKSLILEEGMLENFKDLQSGLNTCGIDIEMTNGWRGEVEQDQDKATGHSRASFGHSAHNYAVAFDCAPIIDGVLTWPSDGTIWETIGEVGKRLGMIWGGNFHSITDYPHFEMNGWAGMDLTLYSEAPPSTPA